MDIFLLHNAAWYLRILGWSFLYFYYIHEFKNRFRNPVYTVVCFLFCFLVDVRINFNFFRYAIQIILGLACHIGVTFFLKKSDWKNIFFGAVIYEVVHDLGVMIYDIEDGYLPGSFLFSTFPLKAKSYIFSIISLLIGFLLIFAAKKLDIFHNKKKLPLNHMAMLLIPSFLYFLERDFQLKFFNSYDLTPNEGFVVNFYIILFLLAFCVLTMSVMTNQLLIEQQQQEDLQNMKLLFTRQRQNYLAKISANNDLNQKYHDLKNCLLSLQVDTDSVSDAKKHLEQELEHIITPLETELDSGNEYLNIVLKEKLLQCHEKGIRLTPYIDARCLDFMDGLDICVLAGNILDNAIQAVENLPEEQREIHMKVCRIRGMVSLHFHNPYKGSIILGENGLPETTKASVGEHGYGLKGAKQIAEKYHGTLTVRTENHEFNVDILIPSP